MKNFVIVHGAWQGNYSWFMVKENLENLGHHVIDITLPGHGKDDVNVAELTMEIYRDAVIEKIGNVDDKVFLVGHSMGGMVVSSVAEMIPEKINGMIYICAYVPENDQSLNYLRLQNINSAVKGHTLLSLEEGTIDIAKDKIIDIFYHDAEAYHKLAMDRHHPEPIAPFKDPIILTEERFGQIPKFYVHALNDRAIPYSFQEVMADRAKIKDRFSLSCGHMPQLAMPDELTDILDNLAKGK